MKTRPAYYTLDAYPQLQPLCNNWEVLQEEYLQLDMPEMDIDRSGSYEEDVQNIATAIQTGKGYGWIKGWAGDSAHWLNFAIRTFDEGFNQLIKSTFIDKLPRTYELLCQVPNVKVAGYAMLKPYSIIHCHNHLEIFDEGLLQLHLPIATAAEQNYAYLNVNGTFRQHICGEPIIFDGSLDHFALNESETDRVVLYLEFKK